MLTRTKPGIMLTYAVLSGTRIFVCVPILRLRREAFHKRDFTG